MGGTPIIILREGTERTKGKGAQEGNINAAMQIANMVKSSLGPRGMDKMLVDSVGDVVITNDGVTILKKMDVNHPAAKMLIEVAKVQDEECGDGTTTSVVLAGELLKRSLDMVEANVHPTIITSGYRMAAQHALKKLEKLGIDITPDDEEMLKEIAHTSMISKIVSSSRTHLADLGVKAVKAVAEESNGGYKIDLDNVQVIKKSGASMEESELITGVIIDRGPVHPSMPKKLEKAKIALISCALEIKKTEVDAKITIRDPSQLSAFMMEEERMLREMVEKVKKSGANAVICQKGIDELAQHFLTKAGIYAIRRIKKSDMKKLAKATGAQIVNSLDELGKSDLGYAGLVEVRKIADDEMTFITDCKNPLAVSILLRGGTSHVLDEVERSLEDALNVISVAVEDGKMVSGGGSTFMELSMDLRPYASSVGGREQIAIDAFASALEIIPTVLAQNAGLDPIDILIDMRKAHKDGKKYYGVNVFKGGVVDMLKDKVVEPLRVPKQAINSATEAAVMILRIDDVIASRGAPPSMGPAPGKYDIKGEGSEFDKEWA
ncbi:MAG: thermosome subunit [Methanomassiliicoccales archaeon]|nr:thermosome subunit [Methanomassiliicoccales archaeon]NYT15996.1 thermosome subunit [Methanomassiliicoccales archaeon]